MNAKRFQEVEKLFHKARALDAAERASFLDEACGAALDLRSEVESLLAHSDGGTSRIHLRPDAETPAVTIVERGPVSEGPGSRIGPYKILQQIGEGGFGVVYMAEQEAPVRRRVALKIIKLGMDTRQVIARFEAERQALALMDHPNIARVLEAGATETGRPYFVMELVKGIPIVEYANPSTSATRSSTPTRRASSTAISSRRTCW
jgi:serine/threonine protein kinase